MAAVPGRPPPARRLIHVAATVLVVVVLPVVLMDVLVGGFGADAMFVGLVYGVVGAKLGGTRRMSYLAPAVGVAAGLGALTAYDWWWVVLLTVSGLIAGAAPGNVGTEAAHRGSEILTGIAILVAGLALVHSLGSWLAKRYPEPVLA